jgi:CheY-like chemotaxis protein
MRPNTRVLVVDDEALVRQLITTVLKAQGYAVETAASGLEALERIASDPPAVVLLDLMMPVMDGWAVLDRVRAMAAPPPVVVVSAYVDEPGVKDRAREAGAFAALSKPFRFGELTDVCTAALRSRPDLP